MRRAVLCKIASRTSGVSGEGQQSLSCRFYRNAIHSKSCICGRLETFSVPENAVWRSSRSPRPSKTGMVRTFCSSEDFDVSSNIDCKAENRMGLLKKPSIPARIARLFPVFFAVHVP